MATGGDIKQRGNDIGPTGREVARNVKRVRVARDMTQQDLSDRLSRLGRPIPVASIGKIESGLRRVEVDDLVALSIALEVPPVALLLPYTRTPNDPVTLTGVDGERTRARQAWDWGTGALPLRYDASATHGDEELQDHATNAWPWWLEVHTGEPTYSGAEAHGKLAFDRQSPEETEIHDRYLQHRVVSDGQAADTAE
jgi:transcriptional regulator with XRE-family HTH domain